MGRAFYRSLSFFLCFLLIFGDISCVYAQDAQEQEAEIPGDESSEDSAEASVSENSVAVPCPTPLPSADEDVPEEDTGDIRYARADVSGQLIQAGGHPEFAGDDEDIVYAADTAGVRKAILEGLIAFESEIDISAFGIDEGDIAAIYANVVNSNPELFYVTGAFGFSYDYKDMVLSIEPEYSSYFTRESVEIFNAKVDEILKNVSSAASDIEKLLVLHEYLVTHVEYDHSKKKPGAYDAYGCLVNGMAVCQGYSEGYHCLLKKMGINCKVVYSGTLEHTWNMVKLGGKWYYIDVTYDDPDTTDPFYCRHTNFLRSRDGLVDADHNSNDWISTDDGVNVFKAYSGGTTYDSFFWSDILRPVPVAGGYALYYSAGKLNMYDLAKGGVKQYSPQGNCTSMTSVAGVFYYSTQSSIYSLTTEGKINKCYTLNATEGSYGSIYELTPESYGVRFHIMKAAYTAVLYTSVYVIDGLPVPTGVSTPSPTKSPTVTPTNAVTLTPTPTAVPTTESKSLSVLLEQTSYTYTGSAIKPVVNVFYGGALLKEEVDYNVKYSKNVNVGTAASLTVSGINLPFTATRAFTITAKNITDSDISAMDMYLLRGSKISEPQIYYGSVILGKKDISYDSALRFEADGIFTVEGKGNYCGERNISVKVIDEKKPGIKLSLSPHEHIYSGEEQKLSATELKVYDQLTGTKELIQDVDYKVFYPSDIISAGVKKIKVTGIGQYSGSIEKSYKILPKKTGKISSGGPKELHYHPDGVRPVISVTIDGVKLEPGRDYKIKYASNKKIGSGKYTITFIGNYKGFEKRTGYFAIRAAKLDDGGSLILPDMCFTREGKYFQTPVVVKDNKVVAASQLNVRYYVNGQKLENYTRIKGDNLGDTGELKVDVVVDGRNNYSGTLKGSYLIRRADKDHDIAGAKVSIINRTTGKKVSSYTYTGDPIVVGGDDEIVVTIGKEKTVLEAGKDYSVKYAANVDKGKAVVIISGMGAYAGSKKINFKIVKGRL